MSAPDRVELIRLSNTLTGLDFVQVSADQLELLAFVNHRVLPAPLAAALATITPDQVEIRAMGKIVPETVAVTQHVLPILSVNGRPALLDFASQRYPDWQDRLEADVGLVFVELLSALGDEFAYGDDRIAREHALGDASQRRSLRHLAALVDYPPDNGSGAFTWIDVEANSAGLLATGTP